MALSPPLSPPKPVTRCDGRGGASPPIGTRQAHIEGRFVRITAHQLVLAWWLHVEGHITRRQLRVFFAACEMLERRRYMPQADERGREHTPRYGIPELAGLVGGRGCENAATGLRSDLRGLAALGLVRMEPHSLTVAVSVDEIKLADVSGFWTMFARMPNRARAVPVPRRTLRALAGGFSRAVTGVMIALLIRSLFWHQERGDYRTDGRTKASWIADVFGISRRAVTDARARLIALGWLEPLPTAQWELNRWGLHDRVCPDWTPAETGAAAGEGSSESASPSGRIDTESASPCLNQSSSFGDSKKTSKPGKPDRTGLSLEADSGSRKKRGGAGGPPTLRDIQTIDLDETDRLLTLHEQAVDVGLSNRSEGALLEFFSLAERARTRGINPGGLFRWLLTHRRFDFITNADEDAAVARLRTHRNGPTVRPQGRSTKVAPDEFTEDDHFVSACLRVAQQKLLAEPLFAAQIARGWSRQQWDIAHAAFMERQVQRWQGWNAGSADDER